MGCSTLCCVQVRNILKLGGTAAPGPVVTVVVVADEEPCESSRNPLTHTACRSLCAGAQHPEARRHALSRACDSSRNRRTHTEYPSGCFSCVLGRQVRNILKPGGTLLLGFPVGDASTRVQRRTVQGRTHPFSPHDGGLGAGEDSGGGPGRRCWRTNTEKARWTVTALLVLTVDGRPGARGVRARHPAWRTHGTRGARSRVRQWRRHGFSKKWGQDSQVQGGPPRATAQHQLRTTRRALTAETGAWCASAHLGPQTLSAGMDRAHPAPIPAPVLGPSGAVA